MLACRTTVTGHTYVGSVAPSQCHMPQVSNLPAHAAVCCWERQTVHVSAQRLHCTICTGDRQDGVGRLPMQRAAGCALCYHTSARTSVSQAALAKRYAQWPLRTTGPAHPCTALHRSPARRQWPMISQHRCVLLPMSSCMIDTQVHAQFRKSRCAKHSPLNPQPAASCGMESMLVQPRAM